MKKNIFLKLFGGYAVIIAALSVLVLVFAFARIRSHYENTLAGELESLGRVLNVSVRPLVEAGRPAELDAFVKKAGRDIHARITIVDPEGKVLADSDADPGKMESHRYRPEIAEALEGRVGRSLRFSYTVEQNMLYVGLAIENGGHPLGIIRLSYFLSSVDQLLAGLRASILRMVLLVALAALGLAFAFSLRIARPIGKLTRAAGEVAAGRFDTRVVLSHRDEFRALGDVFNSMSGRIREQFAVINGQKDELDRIVSSLREGLLVADREARIALVNDRLKDIIGESHPEGRFVWEVLRMPRIQEFVGRALVSPEPATAEIEIEEKTYLCTAAGIQQRGGILLTLNDITPIKLTERIKRDFIVNASHELRTPLTAIQGAVEMLDEDAAGPDRAVVDILKRQVERLRNIVEDLLELVVVEDRAVPLDLANVNLVTMARDVLESFAARMKDKGIESEVTAPADLPRVQADPDLLEQVLINLVDNAVKYTDSGRVDVVLSADAGEIRLSVRDTGIGIPAEHLDRIFERFYVVDKSRSRKSGGTGLGLSIVKHIAERHGGRISVESAPGRGSTFTVSLPVRQSS
jgi:two-component system, OmpR family, phosphate regulon sensor histidine kinase PhoR